MNRILIFLGWNSSEICRGIYTFGAEQEWSINNQAAVTGHSGPKMNFDGCLFNVYRNEKVRQALTTIDGPCVNLSYDPDPTTAQVRIHNDDKAIGRTAAAYFQSQGYEHFAFYNQYACPTDAFRLEGYCEELACSQYTPHIIDYASARTELSGESLRQWLNQKIINLPKPCALFAPSDFFAYHIEEVCLSLGIRIPHDIAILGANNERMICDFAPTPISSVDTQLFMIGYKGAEILYNILDQRDSSNKVPIQVPPGHVIERESTCVKAVSDESVRKALHFIQYNFRNGISVNDVARACSLSKPTLYRRFQEHLGYSVTEEITRLRIQLATRLTLHTKKKATEIAQQCGLQHSESFSRFFKKHTGKSFQDMRNESHSSNESI